MTRTRITVGFIPLLDCATLVAAAELGFAQSEGIDLTLVRETSWANIRDRVIVGQFNAAHMLGPMPVASSLGIGHLEVPMVAPIALGLGGNAITVAAAVWDEMVAQGATASGDPATQGRALKAVVKSRAVRGLPPLSLAMVYPFSCHNYELRYWLSACGIDPDLDVRLVVIPPPLLVDALREGQVHGFCVGEPWNSLAVAAGVGRIVMPANAIWKLPPEKVLGCRSDWASNHQQELGALVRAIRRAAEWCGESANHAELAALLAEPRHVGTPGEALLRGLSGQLVLQPDTPPVAIEDFLVFARDEATMPRASHALWFYSQMVRWGQIEPTAPNEAAARTAYRPDLYLQALGAGERVPRLQPERGFFDGRDFDPADLQAYLAASPTPPGYRSRT